jgi:hypothetical protein
MTPPARPTPVRYGSRDSSAVAPTARPAIGRPCPVCQTGTVSSRARYCSAACKQRAYRLRHTTAAPVDLAALTAAARRQQPRAAPLVYECPACQARLLAERRCPDCHLFCRRLGLGGLCPHCDEVVTLAEVLGSQEVLLSR